MADENDLQNSISDELREVDNPFKLLMSLSKISRLLENEFEKIWEVFQSIEWKKWDYYWVFYDFIWKELLEKNNKDILKTLLEFHNFWLLNNDDFTKYTWFLKQWFFSKTTLEGYKKLSQQEKHEKIRDYYFNLENDKKEKLEKEKGLNNLVKIKWKINETIIKYSELWFINDEIVWIDDVKKDFLSKASEIDNKFIVLENISNFIKLKNIILSLSDNFAYPIFSPFFLWKLATKINIDSDTLKIIDVLVSNWLSENYEEYLLIKKFFTQLIDRKEMSLKVIFQYLSIIILVLFSLIFLPIALNWLFLLLVILFKIKDTFIIKKIFIRWNFGFWIMSILLITISFVSLISTYKLDNLIILSEKIKIFNDNQIINKFFLKNPINFIFWDDSDEIKKCYQFDYLKEWKSCFEKEDNK